MVAEDVRRLIDRDKERQSSSNLSVYLSVDQSTPENRNRRFEATLRILLQPLETEAAKDEATLESFREASKRCAEFVDDYKPEGKTLVLFSEASSGFFWGKGLQVPMREQTLWGPRPHLRPLLEALDEYERYAFADAQRPSQTVLGSHGRARRDSRNR